jgi:hypothetical protein
MNVRQVPRNNFGAATGGYVGGSRRIEKPGRWD